MDSYKLSHKIVEVPTPVEVDRILTNNPDEVVYRHNLALDSTLTVVDRMYFSREYRHDDMFLNELKRGAARRIDQHILGSTRRDLAVIEHFVLGALPPTAESVYLIDELRRRFKEIRDGLPKLP